MNTNGASGTEPKIQSTLKSENIIFDSKRLIGRKFDDPVVQDDIKNWPFVIKNIANEPRIEVTYRGEKILFAPEQISAMILSKMKSVAEAYLKVEVTRAVITAPAYFNLAQRKATYDAGAIAGLEVIGMISEPTAAALAYGLRHQEYLAPNSNLLIFDLGGGTFDVTILTISEKNEFKVRATAGDTHLGGEDFDNRLVDHCIQEFLRKHKKDIQKNQRALRRLRAACERAKRVLSSSTSTSIELEALCDGVDFRFNMTQAKFEELNAPLFRKTLQPLQRALQDAKMDKKEIDFIVLVGGSTRIPKVQKLLQDFFNGKALDKSLEKSFNLEEAVAYGAAIHAAYLNGDRSENVFGASFKDVTPLSLGVLCGEDKHTAIVIKRNTTIPAQITQVFSTLFDNKVAVNFSIMQGEHFLAKDNYLLGEFVLKGFPLAPKGIPKFHVTFDIDENGILTVTARDSTTGCSNGITIKNVNDHLRQTQVDKMIQDAEKYREEERRICDATRAKDLLESDCFEIQSAILDDFEGGENPEKINVMNKCEEILLWISENPYATQETYENYHKELQSQAQKLFKKAEESTSIEFCSEVENSI